MPETETDIWESVTPLSKEDLVLVVRMVCEERKKSVILRD